MANTVLFLCTGNSCRSQMAEALVNHFLKGSWLAFSAGTLPAGYIHPLTLQVLSEINIEHHGYSKSAEAFREYPFDLVVTVCDEASENCPLWLGSGKRMHIGFSDPSKVEGTPEEMLSAFRVVRDQIKEKVIAALEQFHWEA